jgi:Glycosyltransferase 61
LPVSGLSAQLLHNQLSSKEKPLVVIGANLVARFLVEKLRLPPRLLGYRYFRTETLRTYAAGYGDEYRIAIPEMNVDYELPLNVRKRSELSNASDAWGGSFFEVPHRRTKAAEFAILKNARVVGTRDAFGNEFYSIIGAKDIRVAVNGTGHCDGQRKALRVGATRTRVARAAWLLEVWYGNYFHWMAFHLPKLLLLEEVGWTGPIIGPSTFKSKECRFIGQTLETVGVPLASCIPADFELFEVEQLAVVNLDPYPDRILDKLRNRIARPTKGSRPRRFYISRRDGIWRHLVNEAEIMALLLSRGFEILEPGRLSFAAQAEAMAEADVILGLHGAGLANMILCRPGTLVAEIADAARFPHPAYYALASALGHRYWLIRGEAVDDGRPAYLRDFRLDPKELNEMLSACL